MGWWPFSSSQSSSPNPSESQWHNASTTPSASISEPHAPTKPTIEQELGQFNPIFASSPTSSTSDDASATSQRKGTSTFDSTVYPTTMSCREAFDTAMHCRGPGGQFLHLYRYGEFRQCTEQWGAFWFCMRTRTKPRETKERLIEEWYREREEKRYEAGVRPSSEDVWEERTERLERAFDADLSKVRDIRLEDTREWRRKHEERLAKGKGAIDAAEAS